MADGAPPLGVTSLPHPRTMAGSVCAQLARRPLAGHDLRCNSVSARHGAAGCSSRCAPVALGGQKAYGVFVSPNTGYRNDATNGIAVGDAAEGIYAVFDGTHFNSAAGGE